MAFNEVPRESSISHCLSLIAGIAMFRGYLQTYIDVSVVDMNTIQSSNHINLMCQFNTKLHSIFKPINSNNWSNVDYYLLITWLPIALHMVCLWVSTCFLFI